MSISPISAAGLGESLLTSSRSSQLQQTLQTLQNSITTGNLSGAQSAFQALQKLNQSLTTANGSGSATSSKLTTDTTALGSALSSGNLTTAQSALATVQSDLKSASSPSLTLEANLASQSEQLVQGLLSSLQSTNASSFNASDPTSLLNSVYGAQRGLNVLA